MPVATAVMDDGNEPDRISMRTTRAIKRRLEEAVEMSPPHDMTSFILAAALEKAKQVEEQQVLLSQSLGNQLPPLRTRRAPDLWGEIFAQAQACGANDILLEAGKEVQLRGDRGFTTLKTPELDVASATEVIFYLANRAGITLREQCGEGRFVDSATRLDCRVAFIMPPIAQRMTATVRISGKKVDLPPEVMQHLLAAVAQHKSILLAGPCGSGKTTTLSVLIDRLKNPERHMTVIETHPELKYKCTDGVSYYAATEQVPMAQILRMVSRSLQDLIVVGELVDMDSASMLANIDLMGTPFITTLHASKPAEALERFDCLSGYTLRDALVVAQRAVMVYCAYCSIPTATGRSANGEGCSKCKDGYVRSYLFEVAEAVGGEVKHRYSNGDDLGLFR